MEQSDSSQSDIHAVKERVNSGACPAWKPGEWSMDGAYPEWSRGNGGETLLCGDGPPWLHSLWTIQLVPFLGFLFTKPPDPVLDYMEISLQEQMFNSENFAIFCKTFFTVLLYTSAPYDFDSYRSFPVWGTGMIEFWTCKPTAELKLKGLLTWTIPGHPNGIS